MCMFGPSELRSFLSYSPFANSSQLSALSFHMGDMFRIDNGESAQDLFPTLRDLFGHDDPDRMVHYQRFPSEPKIGCKNKNCETQIGLSRIPWTGCSCYRNSSKVVWTKKVIRQYYCQCLSVTLPWSSSVKEGFRVAQFQKLRQPPQTSISLRSRTKANRSRSPRRMQQESSDTDTSPADNHAQSCLSDENVKRPGYSVSLQKSYIDEFNAFIQSVSVSESEDADIERELKNTKKWSDKLRNMMEDRKNLVMRLRKDALLVRKEVDNISAQMDDLTKLAEEMNAMITKQKEADADRKEKEVQRKIEQVLKSHNISTESLASFLSHSKKK